MQYFTKTFKDRWFRLYPIGDWHVGSKQCDENFIRHVVDTIRTDDHAVWVGMGDFMENAIVGSKSDVYTQTLPPREQMEHIVDILSPVKDKGLFCIAGNHEQRTMRVVGLSPETYIATRLDIPFMGFSCYAQFYVREEQTGTHRSHHRGFCCYFHHNYGGGYSSGGKVNRAEQLRLIAPTADAIFSGHFHITSRVPVTWFELGKQSVIKKCGYDYITGSALTWDGSYAEEKAKRPASLEHIRVAFFGGTSGKYDNREQVYGIIQPDNVGRQS